MTDHREPHGDRGTGDRARPPPQGGPPADHRADPVGGQPVPHRPAARRRGAQPVRARRDRQHRHQRRQAGPGRRRGLHRGRPRRRRGAAALRVADHQGHEVPAAPGPGRHAGELRRRGRRRRRRAHRGRSPRTRPSWSRSTTPSSSRCSTWRRPSRRAPTLVHPELGTNENAQWVFDSGEAGSGGSATEAISKRRVRLRPDRRQAPLPPAAPRAGVHGAPLRGRRPERRAAGHVVLDPGAAHPQDDAGADPRAPRAQAPRHRPRRGRRLRRQDRRGAGGGHDAAGGPEAGQAGEVDRDPLGVPAHRAPRP